MEAFTSFHRTGLVIYDNFLCFASIFIEAKLCLSISNQNIDHYDIFSVVSKNNSCLTASLMTKF